MAWFKVDDQMYDHPKFTGLSLAAIGLWTASGSYCARHLTDGFLPNTSTPLLRPDASEERAELVTAGLWDEVDGGIMFHDWSEYQPSRESVLADRAAAKERQRRAREAAKSRRESQGSHAVSHAVTSPEVTEKSRRESRSPRPDPTRPVVPTELPTEGAASQPRRRSASHPIPEDWQPSDAHKSYAAEHHLDLSSEAFRFRNNALAKDLRYARWNAAFSTWLANSVRWDGPRPRQQESGGGSLEASLWARAREQVRR